MLVSPDGPRVRTNLGFAIDGVRPLSALELAVICEVFGFARPEIIDPWPYEVMFSVQCPQHGNEVLLSESRIESLQNTLAGIEVRWVCYCGHRGSFTTGRRREHSHIQ